MAQQHIDDEVFGKVYDARLARRLLAHLVPYRATMAFALLLLGALSLLELAGPFLMKVAIDQYITPGQLDGLGPLAILYVIVLVAEFGLRYQQNYLLNQTGQRAMHDLRVE